MSYRIATLGLLVLCLLPLLACTGGVAIMSTPRWACPSPTPRPWGTEGPVKEIIRHTETISRDGRLIVSTWDELIFFELWEQEYPSAAGTPFPSPTPYARVGRSYSFGQRVELWPLHALVTVGATTAIAPTQQLYQVEITWINHTLDAIPVDYQQQLRLRAITTASGALISDRNWGVTAAALQAMGVAELPTMIPPGTSSVLLPIIAPVGTAQTVELDFTPTLGLSPRLAAITPRVATAIATPTTSNDDLRAVAQNPLTVQWSSARWVPPGASPCTDPGVVTDWLPGPGVAWGVEEPLTLAAPSGVGRVVQVARNQVGKRYLWGAKGPEAFDCSGLMSWSYAQIGVEIPSGTAGQWPGLRPVNPGALQPGDLIFFAMAGRGVDHVGMLAGDLNGDGRWDMVHAASPTLGVRVEYAIFESAYYGPRIRGFRTAR